MTLGEYLAAAAKRPWGWREHDCCTLPAHWAGVPLPEYGNEAEAEAMIAAAGGLAPLWDRASAGRAEPIAPHQLEPGDVGVIELIAPDMTVVEVGAIWTGKRWAFVPRSGGIAGVSTVCMKAWRPACLKR